MKPAARAARYPRGMQPRALRLLRTAAAALLLGAASWAAAHATLVFVTVETTPAPPLPGEPTTLSIVMRDPVDAPVEDAIVFVEASQPGQEGITTDRFVETEPGAYETTVRFPSDGDWTLLFRDRTFRQEEANATITVQVGADATGEPPSFIFPPTATGPQNLTTWLVWLIGLPLVAGAIVTVMVLRGREDEGAEATDASDAAEADAAQP